eukprot:g4430.t1
MESIESEITQQDYQGLKTRELRRKFAKDQYENSKEAAELRSLGQATAIRKTQQEEDERRNRLLKQTPRTQKTSKELLIEDEVKEIERSLPPEELQAAVLDFVQVLLEVTPHTSLMIKFLFPEAYPEELVLMELKSSYLDEELLEKLKIAAEIEGRKLIGKQQVLRIVDRLRMILIKNRLASAYSELKQLRNYFADKDDCVLKTANEKHGRISINLKSSRYYLNLELSIPLQYPAKAAEIAQHESNLPKEALALCLVHANERARALAEFPELGEEVGVNRVGAGGGKESKSELLSQSQTLSSRKKVENYANEAEAKKQQTLEFHRQRKAEFISQPSLLIIIQMLYENCLAPLASQKCLICNKSLLPSNPGLLEKVPRNMETLRLYCGHFYHFKCLEGYLSVPPFGKTCLQCGVKIQHSKLMTDEKILEQRWTHQQARKREIDDVTEFMNL